MTASFDKARWEAAVAQPDWYIQMHPELTALRERWESQSGDPEATDLQYAVRDFFDEALRAGKIALGRTGQNLDIERQPIDTIVVHHTSAAPGYPLSRMDSDQMLRVYVPYFNNPTGKGEERLKGQPLWSNHVRNGRPVFYLYHWLLRMDGTAERLLEDHEIGWHAANWDVNCRSVGVCLDNNYERRDPEPEVVRYLGHFIAEQYPSVRLGRVLGHGEVSRTETICPGTNFVGGWKRDVLEAIAKAA